jgi:hypothetical protein
MESLEKFRRKLRLIHVLIFDDKTDKYSRTPIMEIANYPNHHNQGMRMLNIVGLFSFYYYNSTVQYNSVIIVFLSWIRI